MIHHHNQSAVPPQRVVVLGASGFVGGDLTRHLTSQGIDTVTLGSAEVDLSESSSVTKLGQIIKETDALVVISAITPDKGRDIKTFMRNLSMIENLSEYLSGSPCAHVVYISSDAVYDDDAHPVREDSCCSPASFHGLMHLARERMLAATLQAAGTPLMILRPSLLYGAADTHNGYGPNRFMRQAGEGSAISLFGNGEEKRDHVYISDLSSLTRLCLEHKSEGTLNVATGSSVSFADVARYAVALQGKDSKVECNPRSNPITHRHFDTTETIKAFPSFTFTALEKGLAETARSGRKND